MEKLCTVVLCTWYDGKFKWNACYYLLSEDFYNCSNYILIFIRFLLSIHNREMAFATTLNIIAWSCVCIHALFCALFLPPCELVDKITRIIFDFIFKYWYNFANDSICNKQTRFRQKALELHIKTIFVPLRFN